MDLLRNKDFLAGLIFFAFGLAALHIADLDYPMGSLTRMGPGNFPAGLGVILGLFGIFLMARGIGWSRETASWDWRPITCIVASMLAFGFLVPRAGLVPALVAMFFIASGMTRWREVIVLTVVMTAFAVLVFVYLLKLPFQLVPGFYLV
jgi:uncharacterized membrane protein